MLYQLGLPQDASLSVLVVEVFGNITSVLKRLGMPTVCVLPDLRVINIYCS